MFRLMPIGSALLAACAAATPPSPPPSRVVPAPKSSAARAAPPVAADDPDDGGIASLELDWSYHPPEGNVLFETASSELRSIDARELEKVATFMASRPGVTMRIAVYSDNLGSDDFNLRLTAARAHAVGRALVQHGARCRRLRAVGFGSTRPIVCQQCDMRRLNRRIEIRLDDPRDQLDGALIQDVCAALPPDALRWSTRP